MGAIDNVKRNYKQRLDDAGLVQIESVPEWAGDDEEALEIFIRPFMTVHRSKEIATLSAQGKPTEAMMHTLVSNALDADGKPHFRKADMPVLMRHADLDIVSRVVQSMNEVWNYNEIGEPDLEEMEKN